MKGTPVPYSLPSDAIKEGVGRNSGCASPTPSSTAAPSGKLEVFICRYMRILRCFLRVLSSSHRAALFLSESVFSELLLPARRSRALPFPSFPLQWGGTQFALVSAREETGKLQIANPNTSCT